MKVVQEVVREAVEDEEGFEDTEGNGRMDNVDGLATATLGPHSASARRVWIHLRRIARTHAAAASVTLAPPPRGNFFFGQQQRR